MAEDISFRITVKDDGTPVIERFTRKTKEAAKDVETAAEKSGASVDANLGKKATKATQGLTTTMEKGRTAAMAMAGGMGGMGGQASMAASAIAQLVVMGLNPLGIALAGASVGIGLFVSHMNDSEESTKKAHAAWLAYTRSLVEGEAKIREATGGRSVASLLFDFDEAELRKKIDSLNAKKRELYAGGGSLMQQAQLRLYEQGFSSTKKATGRGLFGATSPIDDINKEIVGIEAEIERIDNQRRTFFRGIFDKRAKDADDLAKFQADQLKQARETMEIAAEVDALRAHYLGLDDARASASRAIDSSVADASARQAAVNADADRILAERRARIQASNDAFQSRRIERGRTNPSLAINPAAASIALRDMEMRVAATAARERPWVEAGNRAGDAYVSGISNTLADAAMGRGLDLAQFATSMAETFVRALSDAFVRAALGDPLKNGMNALFKGLGGMFGGGGGLPSGSDGSPVGLFDTAGSGSRPVIVNEIQIAPDGLALAMSPRAARQVFNAGGSSPVRRGGRA